jgi:hypothetical protein
VDPIGDDELLYRRVSVNSGWYSLETGRLDSQAFAPNKTRDVTGLSVYRANLKALEEAAKGQAGKSYFVAVLRAGELRQRGLEVVARPIPGEPGHAEIPDLNANNRKTDRTQELQRVLVELTRSVEGPFPST